MPNGFRTPRAPFKGKVLGRFDKLMEDATREVRTELLQVLARRNVDSSIYIAALADIVGSTAAQQDLVGGAFGKSSFDERMNLFERRARQAYASRMHFKVPKAG